MIRDVWFSFVREVNWGLLTVLDTLENLGARGWLWIVVGFWLLALYVWVRDFPGMLRLFYFLLLLLYFFAFPLWYLSGI